MSETNGTTIDVTIDMSPSAEAKAEAELVAKLKAQYPGVPLTMIGTPKGKLYLRCPAPQIYGEFIDTATKDKASKALAMKSYVLQCVVYPSREEAKVIIDQFPGLASKGSEVLGEMAGQGDSPDFAIKKL